ncbi:MAG: PAS domain-containing protein, partial [Bacteroidota bacterium]
MNYAEMIPAFWEGLSDGMCLLDRQGGILNANPAFAQMFSSFDPQETGQHLLELAELKETGLLLSQLMRLNGLGPLKVPINHLDQILSIHKIENGQNGQSARANEVFVFKREKEDKYSSEALFHLLSDYSIAAWSFDSQLLEFSFAEEIRVFTSQEFPLKIGLPEFGQFLPLDIQAHFMESLRQTITASVPLSLDVPYQAFGKKGWLNFKALPVEEGPRSSKLKGWVKDITASKVQDNHRYRLQLLPNTIRQGLVICNMFGEVEWINSAFSDILTLQIPEVLGKYLPEILINETGEPLKEIEQNIQEGRNFEMDIQIPQPGKSRWIHWQMSAFLNFRKEVEWWVATLTEVNSKKNEEELSHSLAKQRMLNETLIPVVVGLA